MFNNQMMNMIMNLARGGNNPNQIIQSIMQNNPQAKVVMNQMKQSGMSPKQYAEQYAKQNNIDLNQVVSMFTNMGIKL